MSEGKSVVPVPADQPHTAVTPTMAERMSVDNLMMQVWTSLPVTEPGEAGQVARMDMVRHLQGGDAERGGKNIGEVIPVEHFLVHRVTIITEDGEEIEADRCVLIGPDGEATAFTSEGIRKSIQLICASLGLPPYSPPLRLKITQTDTRHGRRFYQLNPVVESKRNDKRKA